MMSKSKGFIEAEISKALTSWEKEYLGRGSVSVKTNILNDLIIVTLQGILTRAEYELCKTKEGRTTIKKVRSDLVESGYNLLKEIVLEITGQKVISFHTDISTRTGERLIVFKLPMNYEETLTTKK